MSTKQKMLDKDARFGLNSLFVIKLIEAEEAYLKASGWLCMKIDGIDSFWAHKRYNHTFTRNHAIMIAKSNDPALTVV